MSFKAGFVNIIGKPNVGKSTLMNELVGERLSIITPKAQTTRHRIQGIVNGDDFQIVYSDTPGILEPAYKLQEGMMQFVNSALADADIFLVMVESHMKSFGHDRLLEKIRKSGTPIILVINKIDLLKGQDELIKYVEHWQKQIPEARILPISALNKINTEQVLRNIKDLLPESQPYFPTDELTDKPQRFFMSEIIREKLFMNYQQEIPYSCEVIIEEFKEEERIIRVRAEIMVARDTQKGIIIGHKGSKLKKVGTEARREAEAFFGKQLFLELYVKVDKDWRDKENRLKQYGYLH